MEYEPKCRARLRQHNLLKRLEFVRSNEEWSGRGRIDFMKRLCCVLFVRLSYVPCTHCWLPAKKRLKAGQI
ncbi:hypothetical protein TMatcc_009850 [Talaromyces marneffei ATCC 18224]